MRITQARLKKLCGYDTNTGELYRLTSTKGYKAGRRFTRATDKGYIVTTLERQTYRVHQLVWLWFNNEWLEELDHRDRNRSNNRIENLRPCERFQNLGNSGPRVHRYKGVSFCKQTERWVAQCAGKKLGRHDTIEQAALAYNDYAKQHFGEFAYLNEVPGA